MRLRHISKNVRSQNWLAVFLDFLIVVFGVFIGIQLGNWNSARKTQHALSDAQARFVAENKANMEATDKFLEGLDSNLNHVERAINALRACRNDDDASDIVDMGINVIRGTGFLNIRKTSLLPSQTILNYCL